MTIRKKILPNFFLQMLMFLAACYIWVQGIATPAVIQLVFVGSLVALFWYAARHLPFPSLFHWFCLCYVALFYFYPILLPAMGIPFRTDPEVVAGYTFLTVGGIHLFAFFYELGRTSKSLKDPDAADVFVVKWYALERMIWFLVLINVMGVMLITIDAGSLSLSTVQEMAQMARTDRRLTSTGLSLLGTYFIFFGSLGYILLPVYMRKKKSIGLIIAILFVLVDIFLIIAYRVRTPVVLHLIAVAVGFLYLRHRVVLNASAAPVKMHQISSRAMIRKMAVVLFMIAFLGIYIRVVRGYISNAKDLSFLMQDLATTVELAIAVDSAVGGDLGYTPMVFRVIEYVPENHEYLEGQSYYRLFFTLLPRFVWPDKPENTGIIVGRWIYPGTVVQSNPPGVMGDLYINFGYFGIFGFALFGLLFSKLDNHRRLAYYLWVAVSFASLFHFARGSFTNIVIQLAVVYMGALLIERYILDEKNK